MKTDKTVPEASIELARVKPGSRVRVVSINGGWEMRQRLNQMGIHNQDLLTVRQAGAFRGPILVEVHGSQVALGCGMARKIRVETVRETA